MTSDGTKFRRYTNLAAAIHLLRTQKITLLDPDKWDDRNDAFYMKLYKEKKELKSFLAICLAAGAETYHHRKVFSPNSDGVCIEFKRKPLLKMFDGQAGVRHQTVEYVYLDRLKGRTPMLEELPFMKRAPYVAEEEYRVIYEDSELSSPFKDFPIDLKWIDRVILSPWMVTNLAESVKATLKSIPGCEDLKMFPSTLISNSDWQDWAKRLAEDK